MVSPDGVVPSWMVSVSASVNLPLHHNTIKSRSSLLATAHPGSPGKGAVKRLWCGVVWRLSGGAPLTNFCRKNHKQHVSLSVDSQQ